MSNRNVLLWLVALAGCGDQSELTEPERSAAPSWLEYSGPGCETGATQIAVSPDGRAVTLLVRNMIAPPLSACVLHLDLDEAHAATIAVRGFTSTRSAVVLRIDSACWTSYETHPGADDEYVLAAQIPACGTANVAVAVRAAQDSLGAVDSIDIDTAPQAAR